MAKPDPLDHDGDGRKGGSLPDPERAEIIAELDARNIPFFKGATTAKLRAKLAAATGAPDPEPTEPQQPEAPPMAVPKNLSTTANTNAEPPAPQPGSPAAIALEVAKRNNRLEQEQREQEAFVEQVQALPGMVKVRILKRGDGQVAKGFQVGGVEQYYARGEIVAFAPSIARALEDRGLAEIEED